MSQLYKQLIVLKAHLLQLIPNVRKLFFKWNKSANSLILPGNIELELPILIPLPVEFFIHDFHFLSAIGSILLVFLILFTATRNLFLKSHNVLIEKLNLF
jgi:hypothetical protein